jgi:hypothetical protein
VSVVVDVGLAQVLCFRVLVRLVVMLHGSVAVRVVVSAHHVFPGRPVPQIVDDVSMLVAVHEGIVVMHRHCPCTS